MARKLPWTADRSSLLKRARIVQQALPPVIQEEVASAKVNTTATVLQPATPGSTPQLHRKQATARSPSSSPIRRLSQPTSKIEPMHSTPPFSDDKYVLVEDEFEAVAKSFTAHLHAAEYDRLRRQAKENPPKRRREIPKSLLAGVAGGDIAPAATVLGLKRKEVHARQNQVLQEELGLGGRNLDPEDGENEVVEDKDDDPWVGTSLAGLMRDKSGEKRSLTGLDRLNSSTRAAKGFRKGNSEPRVETDGRKKKKTQFDIFGVILDEDDEDGTDARREPKIKGESTASTDRRNEARAMEIIWSKTSSAQDDKQEDMDADPRPDIRPKDKHHTPKTSKFEPPPPSPLLPTASSLPSSATRRPSTRPRRSRIHDLYDFDDSQIGRDESPSSPSSSCTTKRPKAGDSSPASRRGPNSKRSEQDKKQDRKARLDEVPVFMM